MATPEEIQAALEKQESESRERIQRTLDAQDPESLLESLDEFVGSFGIGANKGLANIVGLPSDVLNLLFGLAGKGFGKDINTEPFFGSSARVQQLFERGGVLTDLEQAEQATDRVPGDLTESVANRVSARIGEEFGAAALPAAATLRAGQAGVGLSGAFAPIVQGAREAPAAFAGLEALSALGGGVGAATAREITDSPLAEVGGQLVGGLGFGFAGSLFRAGAKGLGLFTKAGQQRAAAERVQDIATVPAEENIRRLETDQILREDLPADETVRRLEQQRLVEPRSGESAEQTLSRIREDEAGIQGPVFTSAQVTNDPGLLALERGITRKNAELVGEFQDVTSQQNQAARAAIREATGGQTESQAIADFLGGRVETLNRQLDARTASAVATARSRIESITPTAGAEDAATIVRFELESGLQNARTTESALWGAIYTGRSVGTQPIKGALADIRARANKVSAPENIPKVAAEDGTDVIKALESAEDVDTILALRSRILEAKRVEGGADRPNGTLLKNLDALQEASLRALGLLEGQATTEGGQQIRAALDFSRHLNDVYTRGPIGRILGFDAKGGQKVSDIETLDKLFRPGRAGGASADAIVATLTSKLGGGDVEGGLRLIEGVRNFIFDEFITSTHGASGTFNPDVAQRFLTRYGSALERFPGIKAQLQEATKSGNLAQIFERSGRRLQATLADTRRSRAAVFLDRDMPQAVRATFTSRKPALAMRELVKQARRDPTGEALEGLKQGVSDHLFNQVKIARLDLAGDPMLSAKSFREFVAANTKTLSAIYSPAEMGRLRQVQAALNRAERSITSSVAGGSDTAQNVNVLVDGALRILGATAGSRATSAIGGQALIGAGAGSRAVRQFFFSVPEEIVQQMVQRAVFDPDLMKTLLAVPTKKTTQAIVQRLHGHLLNLQLPPLEQSQ